MWDRHSITAATLCVLASQNVQASFNLIPLFDAEEVRESFELSQACLSALNMTVSCEETVATSAAHGPDLFEWFEEDVASLCTSTCFSSLKDWLARIDGACTADQSAANNGFVERARNVAYDYLNGHDLVCLQDKDQNYCFYESQGWQGSDYIRWDTYACDHEDPADNPPECDHPDFSTAQISGDMMAMTNLYSKDLYCSECFLKLWRQRLLRHDLPVGESTDYQIDQFSSMQASCSTELPYSTSSRTREAFSMTVTAEDPTMTNPPSPPADIESCTGRIVNATEYYRPCDMLSAEFNVSTGAIRRATNDRYCFFHSSICLPPPCPVEKIYRSDCSDVVQRLSTSSRNVTEAMLLRWNEIEESCDSLRPQYICTGPAGGAFEATATIHAPTAAGTYYATATPDHPTVPGAIEDCGRYHAVASGDSCASIALRYSIDFPQLQEYNSVLNNACSNLWLGYSVCVARVTTGPQSSDGACGPAHRFATCDGTSFGACCSVNGRCGNGDDHCSSQNCLSGACKSSTRISQDGACNATTSCQGSSFGDCCSTSGYCGSSDAYCGAGNCYSGVCDPDIGGKSIDGSCGPYFAGNKTCTGTQFGACCSANGFCGDTEAYCGAGNCYSGDCADAGGSGGGDDSSSCTTEVTFETAYATEWGESIGVVGSLPELGEWDIARGVLLEGRSTGGSATIFSGTFRLPASTGVGYKFVLLQIDGTAVWEGDPNRGVDTPACGLSVITVGGAWNGADGAPSPVCEFVAVYFEARAATAFGEAIYLIGSLPELGEWNLDNAVALSADDYTTDNPLWKGTVRLPAGSDVEYKLVRLQSDGSFAWEADPNKGYTVPTGCDIGAIARGSWNA